ncbi:hypothetical protein JCM10296v2_001510 [Rhodotorula toruloides]
MTALVDSANDVETLAAHAHALPHRFVEMSSSSSFPHPHEQQHHGRQQGGGQSRVDEDDLLDLLASDSFSLESRRDRDLLVLSSFLKSALPGASAGGPAAHPPGPSLAIGGNAGQGLFGAGGGAAAAAGWNGWRPAHQGGGVGGEGVAAPYGSPMSFASTASNMSNVPHHAAPSSSFSPPPVPSSSSSFAFPSPSPSHHSFFPPGSPVTTSSAILSASPASRTQASPFAAPSRHPQQRRPSASSPLFQTQTQTPQTLQQIHQGIRAPACSRERVPTLSSIAPTNGPAAAGGALGLDEQGWKTRLRSAARAKKAQSVEESSDDVMME